MKLLVFGALKWCGPCRKYHEVLDKYVQAYPEARDRIKFLDVDLPENKALADSYGITSIPASVLIKDQDEFNTMIDRKFGAMNLDQLEEFLEGRL